MGNSRRRMRKWMSVIVALTAVSIPVAASANSATSSSRVEVPSIGIPANSTDVLNLMGRCLPGDSLTVTFYWGGISKLAGGPLTISYAGVLKDTRNGAIMSSSDKYEECDDFMGCAATIRLTPVVISDIPAPYGQILYLVAVGPKDARGDNLINHADWHCSNPSAN